MSIFSDTIAQAIRDYRFLLRRYLKQDERVRKLAELRLKESSIYTNDVDLYNVAQGIIKDIQANMEVPEQGYYSYSGIATFAEYLQEYLDNYEVEGDHVIHRAQKASRSLIQAIQLATLPNDRLTDSVADKLRHCNCTVANYGSDEQRELHKHNLARQAILNPTFYEPILDHYDQELQQLSQAA